MVGPGYSGYSVQAEDFMEFQMTASDQGSCSLLIKDILIFSNAPLKFLRSCFYHDGEQMVSGEAAIIVQEERAPLPLTHLSPGNPLLI